jgi:hypothetical protein
MTLIRRRFGTEHLNKIRRTRDLRTPELSESCLRISDDISREYQLSSPYRYAV